jgi:hypothetical protein
LDTNFIIGGCDEDSPVDIPEPPPGLFYLGSVPSIIRCWLNTQFTSSTLLYAVVCTGSQKSTVDLSLIKELDLAANIRRDVDGAYRISLPVYLAEARVTQSNSRSPSPAPQLPSITASFEVTGADQPERADTKKTIRVFIGSDTLRMHSADLLLSRNLMTLYGDDRDKLSVPFVRPEDDTLFKHLATTNVVAELPKLNAAAPEFVSSEKSSKTPSQNADALVPQSRNTEDGSQALLSPTASQVSQHEKAPAAQTTQTAPETGPGSAKHGAEARLPETPAGKDIATPSNDGTHRRESNAAIWGPWRHGTSASGNEGNRESGLLSGYQPASRSNRSMKVLKASKSGVGLSSSARAGSAYEPPPPPRTSGEHRRKSGGSTVVENGTGTGASTLRWESKRSASGAVGMTGTTSTGGSSSSNKTQAGGSESGGKSSTPAPRSATNPLGSASAFSFLMGKPKTGASTSAGE